MAFKYFALSLVLVAIAPIQSSAFSVEISSANIASTRSEADRRLDFTSAVISDTLRALQSAPQERTAAFGGIIDRYVDLGFVLRSTVPPEAWGAMRDDQRAALGTAYRSLAAQGYAEAFSGYSGQKVDIVSVDDLGAGIFKVKSVVAVSPDMSLTIEWISATGPENSVGLRDIVIDGGSTLGNQQSLMGEIWQASEGDVMKFITVFSGAMN